MNHSQPALNALAVLRTQTGGRAVVLVGSDPAGRERAGGASYYAGVHRPPVPNALEAVLTFVADAKRYKEVRVLCGVSSSLPHWSLPLGNKEMMLGYDDALVFRLIGSPAPPPKTAEPTAGSLAARLNRCPPPPGGGPEALSKPGEFTTLGQRIDYLLQTAETEAQASSLLVVDDSWLMHKAQSADGVFGSVEELARRQDYQADMAPSDANAERLARRFAALPQLCRAGQLTLILLLHNRMRADAFRRGNFQSVRVMKLDAQHRPSGDTEERDPAHVVRLFWNLPPEDYIELPTEMDAERPYGLRVAAAGEGEEKPPGQTEIHSAFDLLAQRRLMLEPDPLDELKGMVGMAQIHDELARWLAKLREVMAESRKAARRIPSRNFAILGNPGTGKTTVAHIIARCLRKMGAISSDIFVKANIENLIGRYVGETVAKTTEVLDSALGGVLFIDEAHAIASQNSFGEQCAKTLLPYTDGTKDLCVIVAGYPTQMQAFFALDPGLERRFPQPHFTLPDYSTAELLTIVSRYAEREWGAAFEPEANAVFGERIEEEKARVRREDKPFGNAGFAIELIKSADIWRSHRAPGQPRGKKVISADDIRKAGKTEAA